MQVISFVAPLLLGHSLALVQKHGDSHSSHGHKPPSTIIVQNHPDKIVVHEFPQKEEATVPPGTATLHGNFTVMDIFQSGKEHTYRIPALMALESKDSSSQVVLAFAEKRLHTSKQNPDTGDINVVVRRSEDGGLSWSEEATICDFGKDVCGNPTVVEDSRGRVHLLLTSNPKDNGELSSNINRTVWASKSSDKGRTWEAPRDITPDTKHKSWRWYATGPGHGIRLRHQPVRSLNGRLVVPADHSTEKIVMSQNHEHHSEKELQQVYASHVLLSDDDGETWRMGGAISEDAHEQSNEATVVEQEDGTLLLNARNYLSKGRGITPRLLTNSTDGGESWSTEQVSKALNVADCEGSMTILSTKPDEYSSSLFWSPEKYFISSIQEHGNEESILFTHPSTQNREHLLLSVSNDGGRTWPSNQTVLIHRGKAGYSDLGVLQNGTALVMYENGMTGISLMSILPDAKVATGSGGSPVLRFILVCLLIVALIAEKRTGLVRSFTRRHLEPFRFASLMYELPEKARLVKDTNTGSQDKLDKLAAALPWPIRKAFGIATPEHTWTL